jgi:pimeloyl-ACP methyl ester carboxylesterase
MGAALRTLAARFDAWLYASFAPPLQVSVQDQLVHSRGGAVRVRVFGEAARIAVVMLPDAPALVEHAEDAARKVAATYGVRVAVADMPGFGLSRPAPSYDHSFEAGAGAVLDVLELLGATRVVLHAQCVNGFYALTLAAQRPDIVQGVVLSQTPGVSALRRWAALTIPRPITVPFIGQAAMFSARKSMPTRWFRATLPRDMPDRDTAVAQWVHHADACTAHGGCNCLATLVQGTAHCSAALAARVPPSVPVVALWGAADPTHRRAGTDPTSIREVVPHAVVRVLEGASHAASLEQPDALVEALRDMLPQAVGSGSLGAPPDAASASS